ncbi:MULTISPECIES: hypothetical protein [unclassified Dinoroseobacter]|uniref:hypothetical protein n=1 Tax=unclassified Dinoroseobacter TaxID=2620028 RepID=UPI003C7BBF9D
MKYFIATIATACVLSACAPTEDMSMATAVDPFIGKSLVAADGTTFKFMSDGSVGGMLGGEEIVGAYTVDGAEICSTYSAPERLTGREFCSVPSIDGESVVFNRRDGSQSAVYNIQG